MLGLESIGQFIEDKNDFEPSDLQAIYYMFFEEGIDINAFCKLPLPYIFSVVATRGYFNKKQEDNK